MHFVYILFSPKANRFYIGETADPDERLSHHLQGQQRFTKRADDWVRMFLKQTASEAEARELERKSRVAV